MKVVSKFLMFFIIIGVVVVVGLVALNRSKIQSMVENTDIVKVEENAFGGSVIYVEGDVIYDHTDLASEASVKEGLNVYEGFAIETGNNGRVIVQLDDGSIVRLNNDSAIVLTSMDPNNIVITHENGEVYSRVVTAERAFDVVVDDVTVKSLGTAFKTKNTFADKGVEVYESQVNVTSEATDDVMVEEGQMYYIKADDPELELTVNDIDPEELERDLFILWNKAEDEKDFGDKLGVLKDLKGSESSVESISLTHEGVGKVSWTIEGEPEHGVKVVWSKNPEPTYPSRTGDKYLYITDPETVSASVEAFDGDGRYYIRVCEYLGDSCGVYSNEVQVDFYGTEQITETAPPAANLSLWSNGGTSVGWKADRSSQKGYKLVWSKNPSPVYPNRDGDHNQLYSNSEARSGQISAKAGSGTYYVRVCEYLGGSCGTYSNEITIVIEDDKDDDQDTTSDVSSISLSGSGASVNWSTNGYSAKGFKIVWSKNSSPTYPLRSGDKYIYLTDPNASSTTLNAFDGDGTYYVRVCEYLGGSCGVYSNQITVTLDDGKDDTPADDSSDDDVSSISLWSNGGSSVGWSVNGTSDKGFKIVWSLNPGPTYPLRGGDKYIYLSSPSASSTSLTAFGGDGTYYVRVCEYLGGSCGVYSNQITVELTK